MAENTRKRSYSRDLKRAYNDCVTDIVVYAVLSLLLAALLCMALFYAPAQDLLAEYVLSAKFLLSFLLLLSFNGMLTGFARKKSVKEVSDRSVYAVMLTQKQQSVIFRKMSLQVAASCLLTFVLGILPVLGYGILVLKTKGSFAVLNIGVVFAAVWLLICLFAYGFEVADIASKDGFCTVSDKGIITGGKVYAFDSSLGDVRSIEKKDDVHMIRFRRRTFFWTRLMTSFPLPAGGAVSRELRGMEEDEVLGTYLKPAKKTAEVPRVTRKEEEKKQRAYDIPVPDAQTMPDVTGVTAETAVLPSEETGDTEETVQNVSEDMSEESVEAAEGTYTEEGNASDASSDEGEHRTVYVPDDSQEDDAPTGGIIKYILKVAAILIVALVGLAFAYIYTHGVPDFLKRKEDPIEPLPPEDPIVIDDPEETETLKYELVCKEDGVWYLSVDGGDVLFVDNDHPLPEGYGSKNKEAGAAMDDMIDAAMSSGIRIYIVKGYRSYERQHELYVSYVSPSWAVPEGYSEHQSGLAFDLDMNGAEGTMQEIAFEDTDAFKWLTAHCAEYGFILRYPKDKTDVTGREYEPWHFRYVGKQLAAYLTENGLTLDEVVK